MYRIKKEFTMDCSHFLEDHEGKCKNLHGHSYKVEVWLTGYGLNEMGMLLDFGKIKEVIHDKYDHQCLNDFPEFDLDKDGVRPTAENMAQFFYKIIHMICKGEEHDVGVQKVRIWETETCYAEYSKEW